MKQGKKLTVAERNHVATFRLVPANWLISKRMATTWVIINRNSGKPRTIRAPQK